MLSIEELAKEKNIDPVLLEANSKSIILLVEKALNAGEEFSPELVELCTKYWFSFSEKYANDILENTKHWFSFPEKHSNEIIENKNASLDNLLNKVISALELKKAGKE